MALTLSEIAVSLLEQSISPRVIAVALRCSEQEIIDLRTDYNITVQASDVIGAMNDLAWQAYNRAAFLLHSGNPNQQMNIIRMMFGHMRGLAGSTSPKEMQELIDMFRSTIEMSPDSPDEDDYPIPEDAPA